MIASCTNQTLWHLDSLASSNGFDSQRLVYKTRNTLNEVNFELISSNGALTGYMTSPGRRLGAGKKVPARLCIGQEFFEEEITLHEGNMRARLPENWVSKTTEALKEGQKVSIIIGSIEQTIQPAQFAKFFDQLSKDVR